MIPARRLFPVLLLTCALGLGARSRGQLEPPAEVAAAAEQGRTDRAGAIARLEGMLAGRVDPEDAPWVKLWAGEQRRLAGDLKVARGWFEAVAHDHPAHPLKDAAVVGMALVDADTNLSGNTLATLQLMDVDAAPDTMQADRLRILARTAANEGTPGKKARAMAEEALAHAKSDPIVEARVRLVLADLLPRVDGQRHDATVRLDDAGNPLPPEQVALSLARQAMARGDLETVRSQAQAAQASWPDSPEAAQLAWLEKRAAAGDPTVAGRVGVLLPLTGEYGPPAMRIRDAITLANDRAGKPLELVFVDTQGRADVALEKLQELVLEKGCVAVLGPLHKDAVAATAPAAQGMGVPLVALTQSTEAADAGDYVFRGFLSVEQQVKALVDHATEQQGLLRFAVMYPRNAYGESARDLFVSAATAKGASVTRIVGYDPEGKDFRKEAQDLGQKDYVARSAEWREMTRIAKERKHDVDKLVLPPIIDFDAIFLPDNYRRASLVASSLAYEEFPIGAFRPAFSGGGVTLLGLNGWHSEQIVELGGEYMQSAVFVDAFLPTSNDPSVMDFTSAYQLAYTREPVMLDAVAYDTARVVAAAVQAGGPDRDAIRDQLFEVKLIGPVTGATGFGSDREIARTLEVLTVGRSGIERWQPPEAQMPPQGLPVAPEHP